MQTKRSNILEVDTYILNLTNNHPHNAYFRQYWHRHAISPDHELSEKATHDTSEDSAHENILSISELSEITTHDIDTKHTEKSTLYRDHPEKSDHESINTSGDEMSQSEHSEMTIHRSSQVSTESAKDGENLNTSV